MPRRDLARWSDYARKRTLGGTGSVQGILIDNQTKDGPTDAPVVFPAHSGAWQYYANHLESKMPSLSEKNTEYVEFVYREYDVKTPPDNATSDTSSLKAFFGKTPEWWGDEEKDPLARDLPSFTNTRRRKSGTHAQRKHYQKVIQKGGEKMAARFTADNGASYVIGPKDRLWLARMVFGELRVHSNATFEHLGGFDPNGEISMHVWMAMNLLMTKARGWSLRHLVKKYSEALQGKTGATKDYAQYGTWGKAATAYERTVQGFKKGKENKVWKKKNRKFRQAKNQWMANVAIWPGADEYYSQGAYLNHRGKPVRIPTKLVEFVNRFAAGEIAKPGKIRGKILDTERSDIKWGSGKTYGLSVYTKSGEKVKWKVGDSAEGFPYTDLAPPGFSFRKAAKGMWRGMAFRPPKSGDKKGVSGNMYVRRKGVSESTLQSITAEKVNTGVYADGIPVETEGITKGKLFGTTMEDSLMDYQGQSTEPALPSKEEKQPDNDQPEEKKQPKQEEEQPKSEMAPEEAEGTPIKEAQEASERQQNRADWINGLAKRENGGWRYEGVVDNEDVFRNVFSRANRVKIGGRDNNANSMENVVPVAASLQFGHRLAEHKLLGHKTSTFQFLGAGNKSGILVLSAAGRAGRQALQSIKSMHATLSHNARNMGDFREASAAEVNITAPDGTKNNIFALLGIEKISITNVNDESVVQDGVDVYKMTIEFLVRDFIESTFKRETVFPKDLKGTIVGQMLKDLQVVSIDPSRDDSVTGQVAGFTNWVSKEIMAFIRAIDFIPETGEKFKEAKAEAAKRYTEIDRLADAMPTFQRASKGHIISPSGKIVRRMDAGTDARMIPMGPYLVPDNHAILQSATTRDPAKHPQWYIDLLISLAIGIKNISTRFPLLSFPVGVRSNSIVSVDNALDKKRRSDDTWEDRIRDFGDNQFGGMGEKLVKLIGGSGVSAGAGGKTIKGFYIPSSFEDASREGAQQFEMLGTILNRFAAKALQHANDGEGFANVFGENVAGEVTKQALAEYGSCYPDLDLPEIANTKIKTTPEFYMYDDSLEVPGLAQLSNDANMLDKLIERNMVNSAQSVVRFIAKGGAGKLFVSRNSDYLQKAGEEYTETEKRERKYNGEYGAFANADDANPITEGVKVKDAIGYRSDKYAESPTGSGEATKQQVEEEFGKGVLDGIWNMFKGDSTKGAFYQSIATSSYLNKFVDHRLEAVKGSDFEDENELFARASNYYFANSDGELPDKIYIGPDGAQVKMDAAWDGDMDSASPEEEDAVADQTAPQNTDSNAVSTSDGAAVGGADPGEYQSSTKEEEEYFDPSHNEPQQTIDPSVGRDIAAYENLVSKVKETLKPEIVGRSIVSGIKERMKKDFSLRRAFPTFKIFFIDEDSNEEVGGYHAFDDFYSYSAVQEIRITRSRKIAADLAVLRITDVAHKLTRGRFVDVETTKSDQESESENSLGWWAETQKENPFNNRILREGVKVQIRLGYAPEPDHLETVFLGQITEVAPSEGGKILEIVCQGYGAELEAASMGDAENDTVYFSAQHALVAAILQPFINHFGHWSFNQFYNPAQIRRKYLDFQGSNLGTIDQFIASGQAGMRENFYQITKIMNFRNDPQDDNIFAPPPFLFGDMGIYARFWDNANAYFPFLQTPWEVFKEHELRFPGYVALPLPYGHEPRMTMFFGLRGQRYWATPCSNKEALLAKYWTDLVRSVGSGKEGAKKLASDPRARAGLELLKKNNPGMYNAIAGELYGQSNAIGNYIGATSGRYRSFRNHHIFTSDRHIIKNNIRTNAGRTFNAVQFTYADDQDLVEDLDSLEEINESMKEVEEGGGGTYTAKLNDNLPDHQIRTYEDSFPSCVTSYMAKRYSQGLFLEGVKQSYGGELMVTGEEAIKPYDVVVLQDYITDMHGPVEVEAVTHIFNRDTGFVSVIVPNMLVDVNDMWSKGATDAITQSLALTMMIAYQEGQSSQHRLDKTSTGLSFDSALSKLGAFHFVHWSQTASPVVCTPLTHGGKPLSSMYTGEKYGAMFSNVWGEWHQWWEDFDKGLEMGAMSEELYKKMDGMFLGAMDFFGHDVGF